MAEEICLLLLRTGVPWCGHSEAVEGWSTISRGRGAWPGTITLVDGGFQAQATDR